MLPSYQAVKLAGCQAGKLPSWQAAKLPSCQAAKLQNWPAKNVSKRSRTKPLSCQAAKVASSY